MLTRTAPRRTAAVLMVALVAMLLVATGGSARAGQHRVSAGSTHAAVAQPTGRPVAWTAESPHHDPVLHLDLASTPPAFSTTTHAAPVRTAVETSTPRLTSGVPAPHGRAPPAL